MLVAQARWLPQYKAAIAQAKKNLAMHEKRGTRVKLRQTKGAARLKTKTVEEMRKNAEESRRNAAAADKGKMTKEPVHTGNGNGSIKGNGAAKVGRKLAAAR
jgi:alpha-galactosidase